MLAKIENKLEKYFKTMHGFSVSRIQLDFCLTFLLLKDKEYKLLSIENNLIFSYSESEFIISVETWENVEKLRVILSECISDIYITENNLLNIQIGDRKLIVPHKENYEAWNISGKNGIEIVMLPGGELSTYLNSIG